MIGVMTISLYHNPRCSKSREALALLRSKGAEPDIVLYLETPPTTRELKRVLKLLGLAPRDILRTKEAAYLELGLDDQSLSDAQIVEAMVRSPELIDRPIAMTKVRAVIGRPPERVLELLD